MNRIPTQARGRRSRFFESEGVDELLSMVLELTAELSVLRERQYVTERVLEAHARQAGAEPLDLAAAIEAWEPTAADVERLGAERKRLLATVLRSTDSDTHRAAEADANTETLGRGAGLSEGQGKDQGDDQGGDPSAGEAGAKPPSQVV